MLTPIVSEKPNIQSTATEAAPSPPTTFPPQPLPPDDLKLILFEQLIHARQSRTLINRDEADSTLLARKDDSTGAMEDFAVGQRFVFGNEVAGIGEVRQDLLWVNWHSHGRGHYRLDAF